jgi:hypothetical protein
VEIRASTRRGQARLPIRYEAHVPRLVLALVFLVVGMQVGVVAAGFDAGKAGFSVKFKDEITPYRVTGVFVLPGERLWIEAVAGRAGLRYTLSSASGRLIEGDDNRWLLEAPGKTGEFPVVIRDPVSADSVVLNVFVMVPFERLEGEYLNGYRIGAYPWAPPAQGESYKPPAGFIEVTEASLAVEIGPHFRLGQFLCKQDGCFPKYMVLRERLILKLELVLEKVNEAGYRCDTFHILSGYRTPYYNHAIGNVKYSRHVWGDAADIFVDSDPEDCMMDDLNGDGRIDYRDAGVIYNIIDSMYGKPWYERFLGGLARYRKTPSHGPFVHVDVRGTRARWGV